MNDLISREDLLTEIEISYDNHYKYCTIQAVHDIFNMVFRKIRKAENIKPEYITILYDWIYEEKGIVVCPRCKKKMREGKEIGMIKNYCPNCGAKFC